AGYARVCQWHARYASGILCLEHEEQIIGALGLWPLTQIAYEALVTGKLREEDIEAHYLSIPGTDQTLAWWYVADIILLPQYRGTRTAGILLHQALSLWFRDAPLADLVHLAALAYSIQGKSLLQKLGFQRQGISPDDYAIYTYSTHKKDMQRRYMKILAAYQRNQRK
ncbi:MAG TPA: hypothetical protein VGB77_19425, partial [Abditibacteriaceae bacterium]